MGEATGGGAPLAGVWPGLGGEGHAALGEGWCEAREGGRWTGDAECALRLPLPRGLRAAVLRIGCAPFLPAGGAGPQRLGVMAQGMLAGRFALEGPAVLEVRLPAALLQGAELGLRLLLPDAVPAEEGRRLGVFVRSVELLAPPVAGEAALLLGFEPLGADTALSAVQRRHGAEPAGLFRWAEVTGAQAAAALRAGLEGVGDPGSLRLEMHAGEWVATHRRWGFRRLVTPGLVEEAEAAGREERLQRELRERLLRARAEPGRVFVHHAAEPDDAALPELAAALGGAWLLWVAPGEAGGPWRVPGARVLRAGMPPGPTAAEAAGRWLALCRAARGMTETA